MAVFTAIGTAIVGAITGAGYAATAAAIAAGSLGTTLAVGVISGGLAYATAKVTGVFDPPDISTPEDQGVKIQVAPDTNNKIGIAYGRNFMSGPITDMAISNQNDTMHFCITLSEYVDGATYTVNEIFRDAATLNFQSGNAQVQSVTQQNQSAEKDFEGKIRVRVYAGSTDSGNIIFPPTGVVGPATQMMPHWTNTTAYSMEGLVFAMIEVDYDAEVGLTSLGGFSFDITNSVSNPGDVLIDYLNNERYGCGLSNSLIDVNSITGTGVTELHGYSDTSVTYENNLGANVTQSRYAINGYISTFNDCATNIKKICDACATFFLFDTKQGKFKVIPNRTSSSVFSLNDDNIVSKIQVSSTELYSLFNGADVEFADQNRRDQTNSINISTPSGDRNPNEPDNIIKMRLDLINDNIRASQLANLDLAQSRNGMVLQLETDFSGMQIDVGDIVDITNTDFGFSAKEFRVMKHQELINEGGMTTCGLTLLEYNPDVYSDPDVVESSVQGTVEIPRIPQIVSPPPVVFNNIIADVDQFTLTTTANANVAGSGAIFTVFKDPSTATYTDVVIDNGGSGYLATDSIEVSGSVLRGIAPDNNLTFDVNTVDGGGTITGINNISGNASVYKAQTYGQSITRDAIANISVGGQIEDKPADVTSLSNNNTFINLFSVRSLDFTTGIGIEPGDYSFTSGIVPIGSLPASTTANAGIRANVNILYANGNVQTESFDTVYLNFATIPTILEANKKITIGTGAVSGNVVVKGLTTLSNSPAGDVGFQNIRYDMIRINKGDVF
jgi:hypothetical protein